MKKRSRVIPKPVRLAVLARDNYTCQDCGEPERKIPNGGAWATSLHLHHLKEFTNGGEHTADNLITLCYKCHIRRDGPHTRATRAATIAKRKAALAAEGFVCLSDAARAVGLPIGRLQTQLWKHGITSHKKSPHDKLRLIRLADLEALKAQIAPRAEAA